MSEASALKTIAHATDKGFDPYERSVRVTLGIGKGKKAAAVFLAALNGVDLERGDLAIKDLKKTAIRTLKLDEKGTAHYGLIKTLEKAGLVEATKGLSPDEDEWQYSVTAKAIKRLDALLAGDATGESDAVGGKKRKKKTARRVGGKKGAKRKSTRRNAKTAAGSISSMLDPVRTRLAQLNTEILERETERDAILADVTAIAKGLRKA